MHNKINHFFIFSFMIAIVALSGCSQTVKIKSLEPAQIDRAAALKRIAVLDFENDTPGLSGKIETQISQKKLSSKPFFTVVTRKDINQIQREQKRQYSGLLNESKSVELGELLGTQALITGKITSASANDTSFTESRIKCNDLKCKHPYTYHVSCTKRRINLAANIRMVDVSRGDIIYSDSLSNANTWKHCSDDSNNLPSKSSGLDTLANSIAKQFVYKLTPNYVYTSVTLLEDADTDYTSAQKKLLENGLAFIKSERLDRAEELLTQLYKAQPKSIVAAYDLGIVKEALGNYKEAKIYFAIADKLQTKPIDEINQAVNRIDREIKQREHAKQQIGQK